VHVYRLSTGMRGVRGGGDLNTPYAHVPLRNSRKVGCFAIDATLEIMTSGSIAPEQAFDKLQHKGNMGVVIRTEQFQGQSKFLTRPLKSPQ